MLSTTKTASSPDDMTMVLNTLPLAMRQAFLIEKMQDGSADWLDAARTTGMFNVAKDSGFPKGRLEETLCMIEGAIGFIKSFKYGEVTADPVLGTLKKPYAIPLIESSLDFKAAFARLADEFIDQAKQLEAPATAQRVGKLLPRLFARLMAGAAVLDLPACVERLAQACPDAVGLPVPYDLMGPNAKANSDNDCLTPFGIALMFSRTACLDALAVHASNKMLPIHIGVVRTGTHYNAIYLIDYLTRPDRWCLPSTYAKALTHVLAGPVDDKEKDAYLEMAIRASRSTGQAPYFLPAFQSSGLFDHDPAKTIQLAISNGHEALVHHFKGRMPWDALGFTSSEDDSPMTRCLSLCGQGGRKDEFENAMLAVIDLATEDGKLDLVLHQFTRQMIAPDGAVVYVSVEPLERTMLNGFDRVLLKYLEHGMDPNAPAIAGVEGVLTPQQIADGMQVSASSILRSYTARQRSRAVIDEIDGLSMSTKLKP